MAPQSAQQCQPKLYRTARIDLQCNKCQSATLTAAITGILADWVRFIPSKGFPRAHASFHCASRKHMAHISFCWNWLPTTGWFSLKFNRLWKFAANIYRQPQYQGLWPGYPLEGIKRTAGSHPDKGYPGRRPKKNPNLNAHPNREPKKNPDQFSLI